MFIADSDGQRRRDRPRSEDKDAKNTGQKNHEGAPIKLDWIRPTVLGEIGGHRAAPDHLQATAVVERDDTGSADSALMNSPHKHRLQQNLRHRRLSKLPVQS